jgi:hypothetical protein
LKCLRFLLTKVENSEWKKMLLIKAPKCTKLHIVPKKNSGDDTPEPPSAGGPQTVPQPLDLQNGRTLEGAGEVVEGREEGTNGRDRRKRGMESGGEK